MEDLAAWASKIDLLRPFPISELPREVIDSFQMLSFPWLKGKTVSLMPMGVLGMLVIMDDDPEMVIPLGMGEALIQDETAFLRIIQIKRDYARDGHSPHVIDSHAAWRDINGTS